MTDASTGLHSDLPAPRPARGGWRAVARYALIAFFICALATVVLVGLASTMRAHGVRPEDINGMAARLHGLRLWGLAWQVVAAALIVWRWPAIVRWAERRGRVPAREVAAVIALQPKVAALLVLYLVLVPIGPLNLLHAL
jgi:hypothetical protein